jgi:ceramide glucosyltransferase
MSMTPMSIFQAICLLPVGVGSVYAVCCLFSVYRMNRYGACTSTHAYNEWPAVTILKPVFGLEKGLRENLRSTCLQDYPTFQVVFSVQRLHDPAIPLLLEVQQEFGSERVTVAIEQCVVGPNGKINNLVGGLKHTRHDMLVISDSDIRLRPDYLKTIIAPLADPDVGFVSTLFKAIDAQTRPETMEVLTINADIVPNMAFAVVSGAAKFCVGASTAFRRSTLDGIGGFPSLSNYLVEDYEMGRRILATGKRMVMLPYLVETSVDLKTVRQWWNHLVRCEQSHRAARPGAMFSTIVIRPVPFAVFFALSALGSWMGLMVLASTIAIRLISAGIVMHWWLHDQKGVRSLWLLPFRDVAALGSWVFAFTKRTTIWRETEFALTNNGRLTFPENVGCDTALSQEATSVHQVR